MRSTLRFLVPLSALVASVAEAATTVAPAPPLLGDGKTPATIRIVTDDPSARLKLKLDRGRVGTVTPIAGGAIVEIVPPLVSEPGVLKLTVQAKGATSEEITADLAVVPPWTAGLRVEIDPPAPKANESATIKVTPKGRVPQADGNRQLRLAVSDGTVSELVPSGGAWIARYTPPTGLKDPLQVTVAVVDAAAPWESLGHASIPVTVERSLTFDAPPDSNNVLRIGPREYGPVKASPAGKVAFQVAVGPEHRQGRLDSVSADGLRQTLEVPLPMDVKPAIAFAPLPAKALAGTPLPVLLVCRRTDGEPCTPQDVTLTASGGTVASPVPTGDGWLRADWTLPVSGGATLTAAAGDVTRSATVEVVPPPVAITLAASPPVLDAGVKDLTVTAHVKDARGTAVVGRPPTFVAEGATASGKVVDNGDGSYTQAFKVTAPTVVVRASPALAASGLPVRRLVAWPERRVVGADGASTVTVAVAAEDALGLPVANVPITLSVPQGDGSVAPSATTGPDGIARVTYRAGNATGLVAVVAEGNGLRTATTLWQGAGDAALRPQGSPDDVAAVGRWSAAAPALVVGPPAPAPVAVAPPAAPTDAAPPGPTGPSGPTAPTEAATVAPSAPSAATPKVPRPAGERPFGRARGMLVDAPFGYKSTLNGTAANYPPSAAFSASPLFGAVGVQAGAEGWRGDLGLDAEVGLVGYRLKLENDENDLATSLDLHLAGRYRVWHDGANQSAYAAAGVERTGGLVFEYTDDTRVSADGRLQPLLGARVGGGYRIERGGFLVDLELAETFVPIPVHTRLGATLDVPLGNPALALTLDAGLDARHMTFAVGDDARLRIRQVGVEVAAGVALLAF